MGKDYLKDFNRILEGKHEKQKANIEKEDITQFKKGYKESISEGMNYNSAKFRNILQKNALYEKPLTDEERGYALGVLSENMKFFMKRKNVEKVLDIVKNYNLIEGGIRDSIKEKLNKISKARPYEAKQHKKEFEKYLQTQNPVREKKGIEGKVTSGILIFASLFFLSSNLTGNVVGNLSKTFSNLIGGVLFILGVLGAVVSFRK